MKSKKQIRKDIKYLEVELVKLKYLLEMEQIEWMIDEWKERLITTRATINALKYVLDEN